jgi:hypothetical protein
LIILSSFSDAIGHGLVELQADVRPGVDAEVVKFETAALEQLRAKLNESGLVSPHPSKLPQTGSPVCEFRHNGRFGE